MKLSDQIRKVWADKDGGSDLSQIKPLVDAAERLEAELSTRPIEAGNPHNASGATSAPTPPVESN